MTSPYWGVTGAAARTIGTITVWEAGKAFWKNGGWVDNLSPTQVVASTAANSAIAAVEGYLAYEGGVSIGAAAICHRPNHCWKLSIMFCALDYGDSATIDGRYPNYG